MIEHLRGIPGAKDEIVSQADFATAARVRETKTLCAKQSLWTPFEPRWAKSFRGSLNMTRPDDQVAHCIRALLDKHPQIEPGEIGDRDPGLRAASWTGGS